VTARDGGNADNAGAIVSEPQHKINLECWASLALSPTYTLVLKDSSVTLFLQNDNVYVP